MKVRMRVQLLGYIGTADGIVDGLVPGMEVDLPEEEARRMALAGQAEFVDEPTPVGTPQFVPVYSPTGWPAWRESA